MLTYIGDVDLHAQLVEWENFYNYQRPHGAFQGQGAARGMCRSPTSAAGRIA